jgi:hypothetical protein
MRENEENKEIVMCEPCGCGCPEDKKKDPKECTPEQIKECHPDAEGHPCEEEEKKE